MKLHEYLYKWSYILKQKGLYHEFKSHLNDDRFIKNVDNRDRGIGKTYTLMKLSKKYGIPVLEPNTYLKRMFQFDFPKAKVICIYDLRGFRYDRLLIDEGQMLKEETIKYLNDSGIKLIGFIDRDYGNYWQ